MIASWAKRYIEDDHASTGTRSRKEVTVYTGRDRYYTEVTAGPHELVADEPTPAGGTDRGPTPYDLLVSGLGACTSMTLRMYADRKEWPLDGVSVELEHDRIHAEDCEQCETDEGQVDRIKRRVQLEGNLSETQRERLMEIAEKCPVHRTLTSETIVETVREDG
jgi:putative redox protein